MAKTWFITGSSRGLGRALTQAVLEAGGQVVATARKPEALDDLNAKYGSRVLPVALDVTDPAQCDKAIKAALNAFSRIDVLVNNAGYGFTGAFEEMTDQEFKNQIDTNFWGVVNVTRAALPFLRKQGSGHIIQITSIGGRLAVPGLSGYHAAKFAVEGMSEALAQEVRPLGIKVTIIEPGGFRTDWAGTSMAFAKPIDAYAATVGAMRGYLEQHAGKETGDPIKAAQAILRVANESQPPLRLPLGSDAYGLLGHTYKTNAESLERWKEITLSTDADGADSSLVSQVVLELRRK